MDAPAIVRVLLPLPLAEAFDYAEGEAGPLAPGDIVAVPLAGREVVGVVAERRTAAGANRPLKRVTERLEGPPLPGRTLAFLRWAAEYAVAPPGLPIASTLRGRFARPEKPRPRLVATGGLPQRMTPARERVLAAAGEPIAPGELAQAAGVSTSTVRALVHEGALKEVLPQRLPPPRPDPDRAGPALNASQAAAAEALRDMLRQGGFAVALLDGVTGSGKTEVYLEAAAEVLRRDPSGQALILLPEIALTQAVMDRFAHRFGAPPTEWHSGLTGPQRRRSWEAVAAGEARIVVGARSALFLPYPVLRLIIVDEEHDGAYKQDEGFVYHARDLAVARGKIESATVVLASATPSLESLFNAEAGRYAWLRLADRAAGASLPEISLVDMRANPPPAGSWLSPPLVEALGETLARGEQALLFLNRRGYAPLVLCRACGERLKAPDTDSWLVEHRYSGRLICHVTGFSMPKPARCPACAATDSLASIGPGVERIEEEARRLFPDARIAVFSSDTVSDPQAARALLAQMAEGECDILVATQAAAKGHDFPKLALVGVVDADLGLRGGDLRAGERTFQLLTQVSGRAGRRERLGRALIQTFLPEHPLMQALAAGDRDGFVAAEMAERQAAGLPPYGRLAAVICAGPDLARLEAFCREAAAVAPNAEGVEVYGPADAPFALVRGLRRKRFLVRAERRIDLSAYLAAWRARMRPPFKVRVTIDIDPYSFV